MRKDNREEKIEKAIRKFLKNLRKEIVLGSIYYSDYENRYGLDSHGVCDFFDGYLDYLEEIIYEEKDDFRDDEFNNVLSMYDNDENLYCWFINCEGIISGVDVWEFVETIVTA